MQRVFNFHRVPKITGFMDFVHSPEFWMLENTTFRKLDTFPSSGEGEEDIYSVGPLKKNHWLRLVLYKGPERVDVSLPSPEEEKRCSFRDVSFYSYLEYRTMDRVQKLSDSECYKLSSEPFRLYTSQEYLSQSRIESLTRPKISNELRSKLWRQETLNITGSFK
jgi:hypothetical protein